MSYENFEISLEKPDPATGIGFYTLKSEEASAIFTNFGARWVSMQVKNEKRSFTDVVAGFNSINAYKASTEKYYGAVVGRFANRIARGQFILNGRNFKLAINNPPNHLHGGIMGFHDVIWDVVRYNNNELCLKYFSKDGEEGYPGNLEVTVTYRLIGPSMEIEFNAHSDKDTILNLAHHAFFNLNGVENGNILNHTLFIDASHYLPIDEFSIPLGDPETVKTTPFDFTSGKPVGESISEEHEQLNRGKGYDHNFILNKPYNNYALAASMKGDLSKITMNVYTDQPGLQFYSGNFMKGENIFRQGVPDNYRHTFCLETQHFPDSPNRPQYPSTLLKSGDLFHSRSVYEFLI